MARSIKFWWVLAATAAELGGKAARGLPGAGGIGVCSVSHARAGRAAMRRAGTRAVGFMAASGLEAG